MRQICIGDRWVGEGCPVWIVAEIGQNHNGDVYQAIRLVQAAVKAGVDAVKFQFRDALKEYTAEELAAPHSCPEHAYGETYGEHRQNLDLSLKELKQIQQRIEYNEWPVQMFVTPCHQDLVGPLNRALQPPCFKIASKDNQNRELMIACRKRRKPVLISCQPSTYTMDVDDYADIVMLCRPIYPCPLEEVKLFQYLQMGGLWGWSDHTGSTACAAPAVALGAKVIEAHITFSKLDRGRDHRASLTPKEFTQYVRLIRQTELVMGYNLCETQRPSQVSR